MNNYLIHLLYSWFTYTAVRSWYAHAIVSLGAAVLAGVIAKTFSWPVLVAMQYGATAAMLFYLVKEAADEMRYRREGTFKQRRWADRVKAITDRGGDTLGPVTVCATIWAVRLLQ